MATKNSFKKENKFNSGKVQKSKFNKFPQKKINKKVKTQKLISSIKRFGQKGNFGRGTNIEEEHFTYFLKIFEAIQKPALFSTDRVSMAENVLEETKDQEIHFSSNQLVSRVLESIIGFGSEVHIERFFDVFGEDFRPICTDIYASHVLQKLIEVAFLRAVEGSKIDNKDENPLKKLKAGQVRDSNYNMETKFSKNHKTKCATFLERISKFLLNNLEDFVYDRFANHLIRICVNSLAGVYVPKVPGLKMEKIRKTFFKTPGEWHEILIEFSSRLEMWPQLPELVYNDLTSPLLGIICKALTIVSETESTRFGKKLVKDAFLNDEAAKSGSKYKLKGDQNNEDEENGTEEDEENSKEESDGDSDNKEEKNESGINSNEAKNGEKAFPPVFLHECSVRLLENILNAGNSNLFSEIYEKFFDGRLSALVLNKLSCYAVISLIDNINDKSLYEQIFEELVSNFEKILENGNRYIFTSISKACLRLNTKQAAFITAVQSALHCTASYSEERPKSFIICLLKFKRFEDVNSEEQDYVSLVGSIVVQNMLQFNKPIFLVNCILEMYPRDIANILISPTGSYVGDAFVESKFIGEKSRDKFVKMLDGFFMELALSSSGSRALEKIFLTANDTQKLRIAKELTSRDNKLKTTLFGRITYNKLRLETYKLTPEQWKASWNVKNEITNEHNGNVKGKKNRTNSTSGDKIEEVEGKKRKLSASEEKNGITVVSPKKKSMSEEQSEETSTVNSKIGKKCGGLKPSKDVLNQNLKKTPKKGKKFIEETNSNAESTSGEEKLDTSVVTPKKGKKSGALNHKKDSLNQSLETTPKKGKKSAEDTNDNLEVTSEYQNEDISAVASKKVNKNALKLTMKITPKKGKHDTEETNGSAHKKKKSPVAVAENSALKKKKLEK